MSFIIVSQHTKPSPAEPEPVPDEAAKAERETERKAEMAAMVQCEIIKLRARAEMEGRKAGEDEAKRVLQSAASALQDAWAQLEAPLAKKEQDLAELVTDLAFELARHIIGSEVTASAASLKKLVAKLVGEAAAERREGQNILVRLNPVDHAAINNVADIENLNLLADPKISRGGALVEIFLPGAESSDKITWDATIEARIATIKATLALNKAPAI
ncbi:MAG: FliH/SctL family protein [Acidocella sp.]|nr:FliH/SctL family protein [Acidocella sp.]